MNTAMIYPCWLTRQVITKDAEATFTRYVELPFPPTAGVVLVFDERECDTFEIDSIEWSVADECFWLNAIDRFDAGCSCVAADGCCVLKVDEFILLGWELEGPVRRGYDRVEVEDWSKDLLAPWVFEPHVNYLTKPESP
jgi:hypothetical protein